MDKKEALNRLIDLGYTNHEANVIIVERLSDPREHIVRNILDAME